MRKDYQAAVNNNFHVNNTQGVEINALEGKRLDTNYTNKDLNWNTGTHSGDIYISTPDDTHNLIVNHQKNLNNPDYNWEYKLPETGNYPGVSGFFTDRNTASHSFTADGKFDSVQLGHELQQAPHFDKEKADIAEATGQTYNPEYNRHLDCFRENPKKMQENYGTTDFYAAMSSCTENTAWGDGGGFQGYNPYINEMINNGSFEYVPEKSRSCDLNECVDYADRKNQASNEAQAVNNHIESNNITGSPNERLGYNEISHNNGVDTSTNSNEKGKISSNNIESIGGGGARAPDTNTSSSTTPTAQNQSLPQNNNQIAGSLPEEKPVAPEHNNKIAGTTPDKAEQIDLSNRNLESNTKQGLTEGVGKKTDDSINSATAIT